MDFSTVTLRISLHYSTHKVFTGWLLILLQLLTSHGYILPTKDSTLILLYIVFQSSRLFWTPSSNSLIPLKSQSQSHIETDGQSISKSWCRAPSGAHDQIFITLLTVMVLLFVGRPLWWEDGSVFCICCWSLPAQSFLGLSPLVLTTIFYCLRFETSLFVTSYDSQGHGGGIQPRLHTVATDSCYIAMARTTQKTPFLLQRHVPCNCLANNLSVDLGKHLSRHILL
jgi:hypothetical protein